MAKNWHMHRAKVEQNDEFYTQYSTIEEEVRGDGYKGKFKNQKVSSICDNPSHSNFVRYFQNNFQKLELAGYAARGYEPNPNRKSFLYEMTRCEDGSISECTFDPLVFSLLQQIKIDEKDKERHGHGFIFEAMRHFMQTGLVSFGGSILTLPNKEDFEKFVQDTEKTGE